ncbi:hypothetical protein MHU86_24400 [Fragilaria crotonensis]|nr:hypothetical protein MHU86_24400 [Fragilaria crotonensis]
MMLSTFPWTENSGLLSNTLIFQENFTILNMGVEDMAEKAAADAAFEQGGWPAWIQFKAVVVYKKCTTCCA